MKWTLKNSGFTLLEVLVASVISAFIIMVAVGALRTTTTAKVRAAENTTVADELRYAADLIATDLANIYRDGSYANINFCGTIEEMGSGTVSSLMFNVVSGSGVRSNQPESDICQVHYFLQADEEKSILMRRVSPYAPLEQQVYQTEYTEDTPTGLLIPIAENIIAFDILYYYSNQWQTEWPVESGQLPELVEVTLAAANSKDNTKQMPVVKNFIAVLPKLAEQSEESVQDTDQQSTNNNENNRSETTE